MKKMIFISIIFMFSIYGCNSDHEYSSGDSVLYLNVKYLVTGSAENVDITYVDENGDEQTVFTEELPWSITYKVSDPCHVLWINAVSTNVQRKNIYLFLKNNNETLKKHFEIGENLDVEIYSLAFESHCE